MGGWQVTAGLEPGFYGMRGVVDIELTNRCNAHCSFCPRDATPHQGIMSVEVLEKALERVVELRETDGWWPDAEGVSFCGLGDQLIHPEVHRHVARTRAVGLKVTVNTNAALLTAERGDRLLEAGVSDVCINGGEVGDDYDAVYGLPFERTRANVERFVAAAKDRCKVWIVLVNHHRDREHATDVERFWREVGVTSFMHLDLLNRAGSIYDEIASYDALPQFTEARELLSPRTRGHGCAAPFHFPFIGYDGSYYLCSSDWEKQVSFGSVFDHAITEVIPAKATAVRTGDPICRSCTHSGANRLTAKLIERDAGKATSEDVALLLESIDREVIERELMDDLARNLPGAACLTSATVAGRRLIPVRSA